MPQQRGFGTRVHDTDFHKITITRLQGTGEKKDQVDMLKVTYIETNLSKGKDLPAG